MSWLSELNVGDKVILTGGGWHSDHTVEEVDRITKTLIILKSSRRFRKSNGYSPGESYRRTSIKQWTQAAEDEIKLQLARKKNIKFLQGLDFKKLSDETLAKAIEIINLECES